MQENKAVNPASDPGALQRMVKEEELSSAIKTPTDAGIVVNTIANASSSDNFRGSGQDRPNLQGGCQCETSQLL